MRFRDDTRGATVQIGAVLLFATIIIALALYQATVVPAQNAEIEYKHSQDVETELTQVRNALLTTASVGQPRLASVELGTGYPPRVFLINPQPATGVLRTGEYSNNSIQVSNIVANDPETRDYLNGSWSASTKYLEYVPDYSQYQSAPTRRYEATVLSNYFPDQNTTIPLTDQLLVRGDTITLVSLNGSLGTSRRRAVTVSPEALSAPHQRVQVSPENAGDPVTVTVPTSVSPEMFKKQTTLADQPNVSVVDAGANRVEIQLTGRDTYTLQTARIGVGSDTADPGPHYLTLVENDDDSVTVEVRDRFNNPVAGVTVSVPGTSPFQTSSRLTDANGQATFDVEDGESGTATLSILDNTDARERVRVQVDTATPTGNGNGSDAYTVDWLEGVSAGDNPGLTCTADETCVLDASQQSAVTLTANSSPRVDGGQFRFSTNDTSVGAVSPVSVTSDSNGEASTTLTARGPGTVYAYTSSGGSGDRLEITIENFTREVVYNDDGSAVTGPGRTTPSGLTFSVTNNRLSDVTVTDITVSPESSAVEALGDPSTDEGRFDSEFFVETPTDTYVTDFGGDNSLPDTFTLASGSNANDEHIIGSGETAEYTVYEFVDVGIFSRTPVNMTGENVEFTFTFSDGTSKTFTVTGDESVSSGNNAQNVEIVQTQINNGQIDIQFRNNNPTSVTFTQARLDSYSEATPPGGDDPIDRVVYRPSVSGPTLIAGGSLEGISGPTLSNGANGQVTLQPQRDTTPGAPSVIEDADAESGDTFELTIEFGDGSTRTYTVTL